MKIDHSISNKIANCGLVAALMVVAWHVGLKGAVGSFSWRVWQLSAGGICRVSVPLFFVISGYLLAGHINDADWWKHETAKRVRSLLVPFACWSVIFFVFHTVMAVGANLISHRLWSVNVYWMSGGGLLRILGVHPFRCPAMFQLWYIRALFMLVLLCPLLIAGLRRLGAWFLALLYGGVLLGCSVFLPYTDVREFLTQVCPVFGGAFYFSVGMYFRERGIPFVGWGLLLLACVGSIVLIVAKMICLESGSVVLAELCEKMAIPFLITAVWQLMPEGKLPTWLMGCAMPIYLVHTFFNPLWSLTFGTKFGPTVSMVGNFVFVSAASILFARVVRFVAPRSSTVLFGGR